MLTTIETFDMSQILQPAQRPEDARQDACLMAASQTVVKGTAIGIKTSDQKGYIMVPGASDGTQNFVGFSMYSFVTDANGLAYLGGAAGPNVRLGPWTTMPIWVAGIFNPQEVQTKGTPAGAIITLTPTGTVTTGDVWTTVITYNDLSTETLTFTVGATATATAVCNGIRALWTSNKATSLATVGGTSTVTFTAVNLGNAINVTSGAALSINTTVTGTGTRTQSVTTAASGRAIADILVARPGACVLQNGFWKI